MKRGFTLIELLVVIAIIAIMSAMLMPSYSTTNDRTRVAECDSHFGAIHLAMQMWVEDHGSRPETLRQLYDKGYLSDDALLLCSKTGAEYYYNPTAGREDIMLACVHPDTKSGERPHSFRQSYLSMTGGGKIAEVGRKTGTIPDYGVKQPSATQSAPQPPPPPAPATGPPASAQPPGPPAGPPQ